MEKKYELRPFQEEDAQFLSKLNKAACFNEQRTGKTPVILSVCKRRNINRILFLCPKSAIPVWKHHIKRWYPTLGSIAITGTRKQKEQKLKQWENEGLILSLDTFKKTKSAKGFIDEILKHRPNAVVLDEAHRIQNRKAAITKAVFKTKNIKIKYALTGTPAISKSFKVWPILHWLYPAYFRSYWNFIKEYFFSYSIITPQQQQITKEGNIRPEKKEKLWNILNQFCTQRKRKDVMPWLPEEPPIPVLLEPTAAQLKYLDDLENYFETEDLIVESVLTRLLRYRQICLDPKLLGLKGDSPKTQWILDYIDDYPEEKIIIFSKFTEYLKILHKKLPKAALFVGSASDSQREQITNDFQNGSLNYILANIDAAREAVTWDAASTEIFTDKYPPIGYILQAQDRFVATTPEKAKLPHKIYELQLEGTYDEVIYQMLEKAESETAIINNFKNKLNKEKFKNPQIKTERNC